MLIPIAFTQERKVIIFATTRSNLEVDKRKAMGFLQNRRRMNGEWRSWNILTLWTIDIALDIAYFPSGHHARTVATHCGRRPRGAGEGRFVAYIPELRLLARRMDREAA
jgi:hypothetical protein